VIARKGSEKAEVGWKIPRWEFPLPTEK